MTKQSIFLFVILFLVASGMGWFVVREVGKIENVKETITIPTIKDTEEQNIQKPEEFFSDIDTSDWKTYRNEEYGFEVKYPGDIYRVDEEGFEYISMITFVALDKDMKERYGDIQVLYNGGSGSPIDEKDISSSKEFRLAMIHGRSFYFSDSRHSCDGITDGYCQIPGDAIFFFNEKSYNIRRITFKNLRVPSAIMDPIFIRFLYEFKPL